LPLILAALPPSHQYESTSKSVLRPSTFPVTPKLGNHIFTSPIDIFEFDLIMSSVATKPAFIHHGTWDETTRKHPAMKWMEQETLDFDTHNFSPKWFSKDFTFHKADGTIFSGREKALEAMRELYGPLTAHFHEPYFLVCTEADDGWDMIGQAKMFANLAGNPAPGEKKVKDLQGREWDMGIPGGFHFHYLKDPSAENGGGMVINKAEFMSDSGVPMGIMLKRGLIQAKDLGL
jgi:hypothetical protein